MATPKQRTQSESVAARDEYLRTTHDSPALVEKYLHNHPNPGPSTPDGWLPDHPLDWKPSKKSSGGGLGLTFPSTPSYKKGGKVNKTGLAYLHKGEYVLTKAKAKGRALDKMKNK